MRCSMTAVVAVTALTSLAQAQIVVDGTAEAAYGPARAVQNTVTGFGNSTLGNVGFADGSELDAGYGVIDVRGGYLYLVLAGNLQSNFNKLEVFIDCVPGGQNQLRGDNPDVDFNGLNRMGRLDDSNPGLKFEEDFAADFWFSCTGGNDPYEFYANASQVLTDGGGNGAYLGMSGAGGVIVSALGIEASMNNSNTRGVDGGSSGPSDGSGVVTGVEVKIPLSLLGWTDGPIKVCAFVNGGGHDYMSNQILGGVDGAQNLSCGPDNCNWVDVRTIDFGAVSGTQYFTVELAAACPADLNNDGEVNGADLGLVIGSWGTPGVGDINGDGNTDGADLGIVIGTWGPC